MKNLFIEFCVTIMDKLSEEVGSNPRMAVYIIMILAFGFVVAVLV